MSVSDPSGAGRPSPQEAAVALDSTRQQQEEALTGRREPLALEIILAVTLAAFCASFDFVDDSLIPLTIITVALSVYLSVSKTLRGAALLGFETTGPRIASMPTAYVAVILTGLFAVITAGLYAINPVMSFLGDQVPYPHTALGVIASALAFPLVRLDRRLRIRLLRHIRAHKQGV